MCQVIYKSVIGERQRFFSFNSLCSWPGDNVCINDSVNVLPFAHAFIGCDTAFSSFMQYVDVPAKFYLLVFLQFPEITDNLWNHSIIIIYVKDDNEYFGIWFAAFELENRSIWQKNLLWIYYGFVNERVRFLNILANNPPNLADLIFTQYCYA